MHARNPNGGILDYHGPLYSPAEQPALDALAGNNWPESPEFLRLLMAELRTFYPKVAINQNFIAHSRRGVALRSLRVGEHEYMAFFERDPIQGVSCQFSLFCKSAEAPEQEDVDGVTRTIRVYIEESLGHYRRPRRKQAGRRRA
ncbi:MAG TPA: hypothetical protein VGB97_02630 [Candidatus Paceibacterota bacterium]